MSDTLEQQIKEELAFSNWAAEEEHPEGSLVQRLSEYIDSINLLGGDAEDLMREALVEIENQQDIIERLANTLAEQNRILEVVYGERELEQELSDE